MAVDKDDPEAAAAYERRRGQKHGLAKAPFVLVNLFKKLGGKKKKKAGPRHEEPELAPNAVPLQEGVPSKYLAV